METQIPETSAERETIILKALARWPDRLIPLVLDQEITALDFRSSRSHAQLFQAMVSCYMEDRPVIEDNIRDQLGREIEIPEQFTGLLDIVFGDYPEILDRDPLDMRRHLRELIEESFRAGVSDSLRRSLSKIRSGRGDTLQHVSTLVEELVTMRDRSRTDFDGSVTGEIDLLRGLARKQSGLLGLDSGFPLLNKALRGFEREFYALGGGTGMGKTTFVTQLAFQCLLNNPELNIVYFALDQGRRDILVKFLGEMSWLPVNFIRNPVNSSRLFFTARSAAIEALSSISSRIRIYDDSRGGIEQYEVEQEVRRARLEHPGELMVILDAVENVHGITDMAERVRRLKSLTRQENITLLTTFHLGQQAEMRRPNREEISLASSLFHEPYCVMTLYCDYAVDPQTPLIEWEWGTQDMMVPVVELNIVKNKMSEFSGRLFYRYLNTLATFRECVQVEVNNYNAIIGNLEDSARRNERRDSNS